MKITLAVAAVLLLLGSAFLAIATVRSHAPASNMAAQIASRADVIAAVAAQNAGPVADVARRDSAWRYAAAQGRPSSDARILLAAPLSRTLHAMREDSRGQIEQIMIMDRRGALVAADHLTHDYDQSDEAKWQQTVGRQNRDAVLEARQQRSRGAVDQVSIAIADDGQIIGAVTLRWCNSPGGCGR